MAAAALRMRLFGRVADGLGKEHSLGPAQRQSLGERLSMAVVKPGGKARRGRK